MVFSILVLTKAENIDNVMYSLVVRIIFYWSYKTVHDITRMTDDIAGQLKTSKNMSVGL